MSKCPIPTCENGASPGEICRSCLELERANPGTLANAVQKNWAFRLHLVSVAVLAFCVFEVMVYITTKVVIFAGG